LPKGAISQPLPCWELNDRQANCLAHHMGAYRQFKAGTTGNYLFGKGSSLQPPMHTF
jgi:hypothetical protein